MLKFYTLLGNSFSEIQKDLHVVYGDSFLLNGAISKRMNCFKDGREAIEDGKYTGRQKR